MTTLIINIKELLQVREIEVAKYLPQFPPKKNLLLLEDNLIADFGSMYSVRKSKQTKLLMPTGMILPSWCDSHTHIVYAGNREQEFVDHKWPQL
jgi:imidazolonepropionase